MKTWPAILLSHGRRFVQISRRAHCALHRKSGNLRKPHGIQRMAALVLLGTVIPMLLTGCVLTAILLNDTGKLDYSADTWQFQISWNYMVGLNIGDQPVQIGIPVRSYRVRAQSSAPAGPLYTAAGLARQSDCSLTGYAGIPSSSGGGFVVTDTVPNIQETLHLGAGLTTTTGHFPNGCKDSKMGDPAQQGVSLGTDSHGNNLAAAVAATGVYIFTINPTTQTFTDILITSIPTPLAVAAADLNGDGKPDLVVAAQGNGGTPNYQGSGVYVMLANGDGTFANPVAYTDGYSVTSVTIDDVNGDGKPDLIEAGAAGSGITPGLQVLLGNGDGTFKPAVVSGGVDNFASVSTGDFNGDGKKDVVLSTGQILLGNGDGTFQSPSFTLPILPGASQGYPASFAVADFNNDGKQDIAALYANDSLLGIFIGNGDGTFTAGATYATIYDPYGELTATDLDGDGNIDLFLGGSSGGYFSADGYGNGVFQMFMGYGNGTFFAPPAFPNTVQTTAAGQPGTFFATGDFNGDGKIDVLGNTTGFANGNPTGGLVVLAGDGNGNFRQGSVSSEPPLTLLTAADMNGDGKLDAIYVDQGGAAVGIAVGRGDGTFQPGTAYSLNSQSGQPISNMAVADLNGDGKPDVVVAAPGGLYVYLNNGDGTLGSAMLIDTPSFPEGLALSDLNGDGKTDIVLTNGGLGANTASQVDVYLNKGNGAFQSPASYPAGYSATGIAIADMNKDGKPDLIYQNADANFATGYINVLLGKGDGTFGAPIVSNPLVLGAGSGNIAVADFDGDGNPDVLIADCCGLDYGSMAFGNGDGTLRQDQLLAGVASPRAIAVADMNADKTPDIVFGTGGNAIAVTLNLGLSGLQNNSTPSSTSLTVAPNPATAGQTITFTASVTGSGGTPTGTVTFLDGTSSLGSGSLNSSGVATFTTSSLSSGTHAITADYSGDSNFAASTSAAVNVTVQAPTPSFTIAVSPTSGTVTAGQSAQTTITVTPGNGFNQQVSFACSGLPTGGTCSFSPATVTPNGTAAATTTLTIATTTSTSALQWPIGSGTRGRLLLATAAGSLLWMFRRRRIPAVLRVGILLLVAGTITACGGSGSSKSSGTGSQPQTYNVTITGTAGSESQTASYSLTVQ